MKAPCVALALSLCILAPTIKANTPTVQEAPLKQTSPVTTTASPARTKINLNTADEHTLTGSFRGIGKKRAQTIVAYRQSHQGFKSIEELAEVKGLGQHFVEVNREQLHEVYTVK